MAKVKVVYILSFPKSGSTLLGNVLGSSEEGFHGGEIERIWLRKNPEEVLKRKCGCRRDLRQCSIWGEIFKGFSKSLSSWEFSDVEQWARSMHQSPGRFESISRRYAEIDSKKVQALDQFYRHIQEVTGAPFIIDSSKTIPYLQLLLSIPTLEVHVIHLIRDVRAVLNSRYRKIRVRNKHDLSQPRKWMTVLKNILDWNNFHRRSEALFKEYDKYYPLTYESLTENFKVEINKLCAEIGIAAPPISGNRIHLAVNHTVFGNQNRFRTGEVEVRKDERWKRELSGAHRKIALLLSLPSMHHFK